MPTGSSRSSGACARGGEASGSEEAFWGVRKLLEHLALD